MVSGGKRCLSAVVRPALFHSAFVSMLGNGLSHLYDRNKVQVVLSWKDSEIFEQDDGKGHSNENGDV
jgi:hypothetical protein